MNRMYKKPCPSTARLIFHGFLWAFEVLRYRKVDGRKLVMVFFLGHDPHLSALIEKNIADNARSLQLQLSDIPLESQHQQRITILGYTSDSASVGGTPF